MAFLRQCLQEFRQRSGEHESWSALVGSVLDAETGLDEQRAPSCWYPMSLAAESSYRPPSPGVSPSSPGR
ncbi:hypothetical protein [Azohydromonas caseinilytica]|uniref:Uncharacterized protein n=1 Tax=Azohydromonas caseinilytica TaxID=2728836 RepID=A0A848FIK3_9BURK|nr:hypothetical protein [Azohydromonas caseinilytica]NML19072.1 hypothetical protein [Azohydromonas caseinilytica]